MYCIYLDKEINENEASFEHVIPLSLGGCKKFGIYTSTKKNNEYGSTIEGSFSNDLFVGFKRVEKGTKGHTRKKPYVELKGTNNGRPSTMRIKGINNYVMYDHLSKQEVNLGAVEMKGELRIDSYIPMISKVALSAGFYKYGKKFNDSVDCKTLRFICDNAKNGKWKKLKSDIYFYTKYVKAEKKDEKHVDYYKKMFKKLGCSAIAFEFVEDRLIVNVGINGDYIGMVNVHSDNKKLNHSGALMLWFVIKDKQLYMQEIFSNDFDK